MERLKLWERPPHYVGYDWRNWYPVISQVPTSGDLLAESNFATALERLEAVASEGSNEIAEVDCDMESEPVACVQTAHERHWAVSWVETVMVHKNAPQAVIGEADAIVKALDSYPVLDEDDWSCREWGWFSEQWDSMSVKERVELVQECHGYTLRDCLSCRDNSGGRLGDSVHHFVYERLTRG